MSYKTKINHLTRYTFAVAFLGTLMVFVTPTPAYALSKAEFKDVLCDGLQGPGAEESCRQAADDGVAVITRACLEGESNCNGMKSRTVKLSDWQDKSKAEFKQNIDDWRAAAYEPEGAEECNDIDLNILRCDNDGGNPVTSLVLQIINFLAVGVGVVVVGGIVYGALLYTTSNGDSSKAQQGITTIVNAVIGLLLFIFTYAIINYLVPGGVF